MPPATGALRRGVTPTPASTASHRGPHRPIDDGAETADVYADALSPEYDVVRTYRGEAALEAIGLAVSVVLLDRRLPEISGGGVLPELRGPDVDCRVVVITAVDPDIENVELPFDDSLTKPVSATALC